MATAKERAVLPAGVELPKHLNFVKQLGRGAYGTVFLCDDLNSGMQVAVKHVKNAAKHGKSMLREIRLLARLEHENLLHLVDFPPVPSPNFNDVLLVLPYLPADLLKIIQSRQSLTEKHVQVIVVQILRALDYLHATGVAHRDLKPANILLTSDCKLKICDFGLARGDMLDGDSEEASGGALTEYVVTRWYRAPEVMLLPKQYTSAVDLWSAGCILGEILGRKPMFPGKNHIDMVCRVAKLVGTPTDDELAWLPKDKNAYSFLRNVCPQTSGTPLNSMYPRASDACLDLLRDLLRWDPQLRPSAAQALDQEYLRAYKPKQASPPPEPFDWSFDGFRPTSDAVREKLYQECARLHPEIIERDGFRLVPSTNRRHTPSMNSSSDVSKRAAETDFIQRSAGLAPNRPPSCSPIRSGRSAFQPGVHTTLAAALSNSGVANSGKQTCCSATIGPPPPHSSPHYGVGALPPKPAARAVTPVRGIPSSNASTRTPTPTRGAFGVPIRA